MFSALKKALGRKGGDPAPAPPAKPHEDESSHAAAATLAESAGKTVAVTDSIPAPVLHVADTADELLSPVDCIAPTRTVHVAAQPPPRMPSSDDEGDDSDGGGIDTRGRGRGKRPQPRPDVVVGGAGAGNQPPEPARPKIIVHPPVPRPVVPPAPAPLAAVPESNGRFSVTVTPLAKAPARAVVAMPVHEYGPGACDLSHVVLASADGAVVIYQDDRWDTAEPSTRQLPLEAGDEVTAGFQGGYGVGPTLVSARGHMFGIDSDSGFRVGATGTIAPVPADDAIVAACATTGQSAFAVGFRSGTVAVVRDAAIAPTAAVNIGAPIKPGPDGMRIDYYGNYIAAQHADAPIVTLVAARGSSKADLSIVGRILHGGRFVPEGHTTQPQRSTCIAEGINEGRDAPAIVSMTGDGTDLVIT